MKAKLLSSVVTGCLVIVGVASATSLLVVGCGGDDSGTSPADAGNDQSTDSPGADAGNDTSLADTAADSPTHNDSGFDSGDGDSEGGMPPLPTASEFVPELTQVYCQRLQACCELDAGSFSLAECTAGLFADPLGTGEATPYLDSGLVAYNAVEAQQCLDDMANFPCGTVNAMQNVMLTQDCVGAFSGTQTQDGACMDSIECPATDYCLRPGDGDAGVCTTLVADGGACTTPFGNECSYLALGVPALYCDSVTHTCTPQEPNGADCSIYIACSSGICNSASPRTCSATYVFSDPGVPGGRCASVTAVPDAGGD